MKTRTCIKCNNTKPLDTFLIYTPNDPKASVAYSAICSTCRNRDREESNDIYNAGASINPKIVREMQTRATQTIKSAEHITVQKKLHANKTKKYQTQTYFQENNPVLKSIESSSKIETKPSASAEKSLASAVTTSLFGNVATISKKALENRFQNNAKASRTTTRTTSLFSTENKTEEAVATPTERSTNSK